LKHQRNKKRTTKNKRQVDVQRSLWARGGELKKQNGYKKRKAEKKKKK